jgi:hypothetical protein
MTYLYGFLIIGILAALVLFCVGLYRVSAQYTVDSLGEHQEYLQDGPQR